jgi:hypothetical protein
MILDIFVVYIEETGTMDQGIISRKLASLCRIAQGILHAFLTSEQGMCVAFGCRVIEIGSTNNWLPL